MGVVLDSTVIITAQRGKQSPAELIEAVIQKCGDQVIALFAIGYTELVHGHYRCQTQLQRDQSREFLDALTRRLPVLPCTRQIGERVGRIGAEQASVGNIIPTVDLMIGVTALSFQFSLMTVNLRHFRQIPDLKVMPF